MEKVLGYTLVVLCIIIAVSEARTYISYDEAEEEKCVIRKWKGCSRDDSVCVCGATRACENPYPYRSLRECEKEKNGLNDKCRRHPCIHGECEQIKLENRRRKWQCQCAGSGFYGHRCSKPCPPRERALTDDYPNACIY